MEFYVMETSWKDADVRRSRGRRQVHAHRARHGCEEEGRVMPAVVDSDQHLYEPRSMWSDHIDPSMRDEALRLEDDDRGFTWLTWRGERLELADVHRPGDTASNGRHRQLLRSGERSEYDYDEALPDEYWSPSARVRMARPRRPRRISVLPELRAAVGAAPVGIATGTQGQHERVEPLVRRDRPGGRRTAPSGGAPHIARSRVAHARDQ